LAYNSNIKQNFPSIHTVSLGGRSALKEELADFHEEGKIAIFLELYRPFGVKEIVIRVAMVIARKKK
jgi:hypothetical protein